MNERIKELAKQAEEFSHWTNHGYTANYRINPEKFAELIVRECCEVAHCNFHVDGLTLGTILKEHFGVEE